MNWERIPTRISASDRVRGITVGSDGHHGHFVIDGYTKTKFRVQLCKSKSEISFS